MSLWCLGMRNKHVGRRMKVADEISREVLAAAKGGFLCMLHFVVPIIQLQQLVFIAFIHFLRRRRINNMNGDEYNDDSEIYDENPMDADQYQSNESLNEDEEQRSQKERQEDENENDQNMDSEYESSDRQHQILDQNCIDQFQQPNVDRITSPFLTKYEKARILGVRAIQISKNSPLYVSFGDNHNLDPLIIAEKQLHDGKIPFIVRRYLPNETFEDWKLSELKTFDYKLNIQNNFTMFGIEKTQNIILIKIINKKRDFLKNADLNTAQSQSFSNKNKQNHEKQDCEKDLETCKAKRFPQNQSNITINSQEKRKSNNKSKSLTIDPKHPLFLRKNYLGKGCLFQMKHRLDINQRLNQRKIKEEHQLFKEGTVHFINQLFFEQILEKNKFVKKKIGQYQQAELWKCSQKFSKKPQDKRLKIKVSKINKTHQVQIKQVTLEKKKSGQNFIKPQTNKSVKSLIFKTIPKKKKKQVDLEFELSGW